MLIRKRFLTKSMKELVLYRAGAHTSSLVEIKFLRPSSSSNIGIAPTTGCYVDVVLLNKTPSDARRIGGRQHEH